MKSTKPSNSELMLKLLFIGDSGVGKTSLLLSYTSDSSEGLHTNVGDDFQIKRVTLGGEKLKLVIWDTAGREKFGSYTDSYFRGVHGIVLVYDVTRRETFTNLSKIWTKKINLHSTNKDCVKVLVGNKIDKGSERVVSESEGKQFAKKNGCLFYECSAMMRLNVHECFEHQILKILRTPSLVQRPNGVGVKSESPVKKKMKVDPVKQEKIV